MRVEIVIPYYNEFNRLDGAVRHIGEELRKSDGREFTFRFWWADDGSTDGSTGKLQTLVKQEFDSTIEHKILSGEPNRGKGSAMRRAIEQVKRSACSGAVVVFWDSDGELHPRGIVDGLRLLKDEQADIVFGSRFSKRNVQVLNFRHYLGNKALTVMSNLFSNLNLSDVHCCARFMRAAILFQLPLTSTGFDFEAEFVALVGRVKSPALKLMEVPVQYAPRTAVEGKKIGFAHVIPQIYQALRCRYFLGALKLDGAELSASVAIPSTNTVKDEI